MTGVKSMNREKKIPETDIKMAKPDKPAIEQE